MRLFAFDIDATLFPYGGHEIAQEEIDALQALLDQGDAVVLASGRPFVTLKGFLEQFHGEHRYVVCANGSVAYDIDGNLITKANLTSDDFLHLQKYEQYGASIYAYEGLGGLLSFHKDHWIDYEVEMNLLNEEDITILDPNQPIQGHNELYKIMIAGPKEVMVNLVPDAEDQERYELSRSAPTFLEALPKGANKGSRVDAIREYLHIAPEDVYCFGDEDNDLSMIKRFNGVAMGNAIPSVKKAAKYITLEAKDHGVAYALRHILKVI